MNNLRPYKARAAWTGTGDAIPHAVRQTITTMRGTKMKLTGIVICAVGGCVAALVAAPFVLPALGAAGLLGAAGTGVAISSLSGAALTSASSAAITGTVAGTTAVVGAVGTAIGAAIGVAKKK